jgi:uncharacterized protein HemX
MNNIKNDVRTIRQIVELVFVVLVLGLVVLLLVSAQQSHQQQLDRVEADIQQTTDGTEHMKEALYGRH